MRQEVLGLFSEEYGMTAESFGKIFDALYEHPIQQDICIRLVAMDNGAIAGFQSYMYWPYKGPDGRRYKSFQSGNSIVGKRHRGKGVFTRLLRALNQGDLNLDYDFIVGFPVEQSFGAFMKCGWENPFNLQWFVTPNHPILSSIFGSKIRTNQGWAPLPNGFSNSWTSALEMEFSQEFDDYRSKLRPDQHLRLFKEVKGKTWLVEAKIQQRSRFISETIIGKITCTEGASVPRKSTMKSLTNEVARTTRTTFISFATPPSNLDLPNRYFAIKKELRFIFFPGSTKYEELQAFGMNIGRADVDTW